MPKGFVLKGTLEHPPNPIYRTYLLLTQTDLLPTQTDLLLQQLERNVEMLARTFPDSLIILAGDLNQLKDS